MHFSIARVLNWLNVLESTKHGVRRRTIAIEGGALVVTMFLSKAAITNASSQGSAANTDGEIDSEHGSGAPWPSRPRDSLDSMTPSACSLAR